MNYGQIKQNLISLGFADENDYAEYETLGYTYDAINRAMSSIANHFSCYDKYELEIDDEISGHLEINMNTTVDNFISFAEVPIVKEIRDGIYSKFTDYVIDGDESTLWINAEEHKGVFIIRYKASCTLITSETDEEFIPELPQKTHHLIPLLAAYYLWLDDEAAKAAQYYNLYETELSILLQKSAEPRMRVVTDGRLPWL